MFLLGSTPKSHVVIPAEFKFLDRHGVRPTARRVLPSFSLPAQWLNTLIVNWAPNALKSGKGSAYVISKPSPQRPLSFNL